MVTRWISYISNIVLLISLSLVFTTTTDHIVHPDENVKIIIQLFLSHNIYINVCRLGHSLLLTNTQIIKIVDVI